MLGGPTIVFTRKTAHISKSTKVCKAIVGIHASQLYPYSMCQPLPTGLYTRYKFDADSQKFNPKPHRNKSRSLRNIVMSYYQRMRLDCRIENFDKLGFQKKIDCFNAHGFCGHCNKVFEAIACFCLYSPCQEERLALTEDHNQRGTKKRSWMKFGNSISR